MTIVVVFLFSFRPVCRSTLLPYSPEPPPFSQGLSVLYQGKPLNLLLGCWVPALTWHLWEPREAPSREWVSMLRSKSQHYTTPTRWGPYSSVFVLSLSEPEFLVRIICLADSCQNHCTAETSVQSSKATGSKNICSRWRCCAFKFRTVWFSFTLRR